MNPIKVINNDPSKAIVANRMKFEIRGRAEFIRVHGKAQYDSVINELTSDSQYTLSRCFQILKNRETIAVNDTSHSCGLLFFMIRNINQNTCWIEYDGGAS